MFYMAKITYINGLDIRSTLEVARDELTNVINAATSARQAANGLLGGALQYDPRSVLMVLELLGGLRESIDEVAFEVAVQLYHSESDLSQNSVSRALGVSITKLRALLSDAEALPEPDEN
jgi:predicted HTH domain antitoxin